jgi:hypothetical protein
MRDGAGMTIRDGDFVLHRRGAKVHMCEVLKSARVRAAHIEIQVGDYPHIVRATSVVKITKEEWVLMNLEGV